MQCEFDLKWWIIYLLYIYYDFRGLDFRPAYRKVAGLQSVINTCTLVLTATATRKIQDDINMNLGFETDTTKVVAVLLDRCAGLLHTYLFLFNLTTIYCYNNSKLKISLPLQAKYFLEHEEFNRKIWRRVGLDGRKRNIKGNQSQRHILVYVRSINKCYNIYLWLITSIRDIFFVHKMPSLENRGVEIYHANIDEENKSRKMTEFLKPPGNVQVVISTVAHFMFKLLARSWTMCKGQQSWTCSLLWVQKKCIQMWGRNERHYKTQLMCPFISTEKIPPAWNEY